MQKKIDFNVFQLLNLPPEILYVIFSFLDDENLRKLSQIQLHSLQELLKKYVKTPYYFRQKISQLVEELGLLVDPTKIFQGIENNGDLKILYDYLTAFKLREDYRRRLPFNSDIQNPLTEKITSLGNILQSNIKNNPIVLLLNTKIDFTSEASALKQIQLYKHYVSQSHVISQGVGSSTQIKNSSALTMTKPSGYVEKLEAQAVEKTIQKLEDFKKIEGAGSPVIYLFLIHYGLSTGRIFNNNNLSILNEKIDFAKLNMPLISTLFSAQNEPVSVYDYIKTLLVPLNIELPTVDYFYSKNKKGQVLKSSEKFFAGFLKFLMDIDWLTATRISTVPLLNGLKLIADYFSTTNVDLKKLSILADFSRFYKTPIGLSLIRYILENNNMVDLKKLSALSIMLQAASGELIFKKIVLNPVFFNNSDYEKTIGGWLSQFRLPQGLYMAFGIHSLLMDDFLKKLNNQADIKTMYLHPDALELLSLFENTCWTIDDFNSFFNPSKIGRKRSDDSIRIQKSIFLKQIPEILSYWSPKEVELFFDRFFSQEKSKASANAIHKTLAACGHRGLIFKAFKTYDELKSLHAKINHQDPNKATNFLDLLCASNASKICKKILIQNSPINQIKQYIFAHDEIIQIMLGFQNSDLLLEILQEKLTLDSIMNDDTHVSFLREKLAAFTGFYTNGNSLPDSLNLAFDAVKEDSEFLSVLFKNKFCNSYIADYKITTSFIRENSTLFELLCKEVTETNYSYLKQLNPNKLLNLYQSGILVKLMNISNLVTIQWILFDKNTNAERSIEQIQELFERDFIMNLGAFKERQFTLPDRKWISYNWSASFLTHVPYYPVVMKLLTNDYFSSGCNSLNFIAKQGMVYFMKVMEDLNKQSSNTNKNDMTYILSHIKRWYSMPWVFDLEKVDQGHKIFSVFSLQHIEMLANQTKLFSFLLDNLGFHTNITKSCSPFPSFTNYIKLLKILSELKDPGKNFFILLRQYKDNELIECYESNPVFFNALMNCDKWVLYNAITECPKLNQLNSAKLGNLQGHDSKRQKVSQDQKEATSSMNIEENLSEPSQKLSK